MTIDIINKPCWMKQVCITSKNLGVKPLSIKSILMNIIEV
jgi:hypothetical protein